MNTDWPPRAGGKDPKDLKDRKGPYDERVTQSLRSLRSLRSFPPALGGRQSVFVHVFGTKY